MGFAGQLNIDGTAKPHPVEQDRFLRQPGERRAVADREPDADRRVRPERAIDLLGRGGRGGQPRATADFEIEVESITAGHAARGVDDHGIERAITLAIGKTNPQRTSLVHPCPAAQAAGGDDRQGDMSGSAIGREGLFARHGSRA